MDKLILSKSREVKHCPPHFTKVPIEIKTTSKFHLNALPSGMHQEIEGSSTTRIVIRNWLHENIDNRFFIGDSFNSRAGLLVESFSVAFEEPADATYFTLLLPSFID